MTLFKEKFNFWYRKFYLLFTSTEPQANNSCSGLNWHALKPLKKQRKIQKIKFNFLIYIRWFALYGFKILTLFKIKSIDFISKIKTLFFNKTFSISFLTLLQHNKDHKMNIDNQNLVLVLVFVLYNNFLLENEIQYNDLHA